MLRLLYLRTNTKKRSLRKLGPKPEDHGTVGAICMACGEKFVAGDRTTTLPLGPGEDEDEQAKARAGRPYTAIGIELHWSCATGEE